MVRTAVKTLTLNVYAIPLPSVQQFVASRPAAAYFSQLAAYIAEQCQVGLGDRVGAGDGAADQRLLSRGFDGRCRAADGQPRAG
jgi:hypothetical protein